MFERYTESARRALFYARYAATQRGSATIDTEHLLLGLLREPGRLGKRIVDDAAVSEARVTADLDERTPTLAHVPASVEIPFGAELKHVLAQAATEADQLQHPYIGTEHLLLALLDDERTLAGSLLARYGLRQAAVRTRIVELVGERGTDRGE